MSRKRTSRHWRGSKRPAGKPSATDGNVLLASRSKLRAGEFILGEEPKPTQAIPRSCKYHY